MFQPTPVPPPQTIGEVFTRLQERLLAAAPSIFMGAMVFAIFLSVAWAGQRIIAYAAPRVHADTGVVVLLSRVFYYSVLIFGLITALSTTGLNVSALIAGLGLTGFALGFALKDVLSNLLSGIMLLIYRPFRIGDQIAMGSYEGTIQMIRMRDTVVRSYDGRLIIIPNTKLITEVVINNAAVRFVRESVEVVIAPDVNLDVARETFVRVMGENPALRGRVEPLVNVKGAEDHTTRLEGHFWYDPRQTNKASIKDEVTQAVVRGLGEVGIRATVPPPPQQRVPEEQKDGEKGEDDAGETEGSPRAVPVRDEI